MRLDTTPVGKKGREGCIGIPFDIEGVGRIGRLGIGSPVPTGSSIDCNSEGLIERPIDGRGMLDGGAQLAFCASAKPTRPMARIEASRIILKAKERKPVSTDFHV